MKGSKLRTIVFMTLCCDLGIFAKKIILPAANVITDFLHIPGGIGTSFSIMFIVIAVAFIPKFGCAALMGIVQSVIALCLGSVGSLGLLSPVGYIVPALSIDCVMLVSRKLHIDRGSALLIANITASFAASFVSNLIVFKLRGLVFILYSLVAVTSGAICGALSESVVSRLESVLKSEK